MKFNKGILTSAILSATLAGLSGTAQATSATVSSSKTISKTSSSSMSKKTKYGSFGANYSASYTLYSNETGSSKYESAEVTAKATLFGVEKTMLRAYGKLSAGLSTTVTEDYIFSIAGVDVAVIAGGAVAASEATSGAWGEVSVDADLCLKLAEASSEVMVGPIPVTTSLEAVGCPNLYLTAAATYSSSQSSINTTIKPSFAVDLSGSVGFGGSVASAGVEVDVNLLTLSLPIVNALTLVPATKTLTYTTTGTLTLESLAGSIGLYAKLAFLKYTYTLFDWDGISGGWVLFSDSVPTASSAVATVSGNTATGTYAYLDPAGLSDSGSIYEWRRASVSSGVGWTSVGTTKDWTLTTSDNDKYLKFCVTPYNGHNYGVQACSSWSAVGHLLELFQNDSYGGNSDNLAYEQSLSGTCLNLTDTSFNDAMSSFQFYSPTSAAATLWIFKDIDCTGGSKSFSTAMNAGYSSSSIHTTLDDSWNDKVTSVMVITGETVAAEDVTATVSASTATGSYTFATNSAADDATSAWYWRRASSSAGADSATISNSNSKTHALTTSDNMMYLSWCVTPTNGYTTGESVCSDWTSVGHLVELFTDGGYGGTSANFAYEKSGQSTCFNLPSYSFNDTMSSFKFYAPSGSAATLQTFYNGNCSGDTGYYTSSAGNSYLMSSVNSYWNDNVSSFKVSW